jgi:hypothetical protein
MFGLDHRGTMPALLAIVGLGLATAATATTLAPLSVDQLTDASDYVVRGTVNQLWVDTDERGYHWTRVQVEVDAVYKGPADTDALQLDVMGGFLNGEGTLSMESPRFDTGEEVLVFAEKLPSGVLVPTGLRQGKATVRIDPDNGQPMLVRYNPEPHKAYDHRFIPHPAPAERVYLSDVVEQVRARVQQGWDGRPIPGKPTERLLEMHPGVEVSR